MNRRDPPRIRAARAWIARSSACGLASPPAATLGAGFLLLLLLLLFSSSAPTTLAPLPHASLGPHDAPSPRLGTASRAAPAPASNPSVRVASTVPGNCTANWRVWTNVSVRFTVAMDPSSTRSAFSVSPTVAGTSIGVSGSWLNWTLSTPLAFGTTYVLGLSTQALSAGGARLERPWSSSFSTVLPTVVSTPQVSGLCPLNRSTNVPVDANLSVQFDQAMDVPSLTGSFSIQPSVAGGQVAAGGDSLTFVHSGAFASNTTYLVTITRGAESFQGVPLAEPVVFSFTTGAPPRTTPAPTNTSSPGGGGTTSWVAGAELLGVGVAIVAATSIATFLWIRRERQRAGDNPTEATPPEDEAEPPLKSGEGEALEATGAGPASQDPGP